MTATITDTSIPGVPNQLADLFHNLDGLDAPGARLMLDGLLQMVQATTAGRLTTDQTATAVRFLLGSGDDNGLAGLLATATAAVLCDASNNPSLHALPAETRDDVQDLAEQYERYQEWAPTDAIAEAGDLIQNT